MEYLRDVPLADDVDFDRLAHLTSRFSYLDLALICEKTKREYLKRKSKDKSAVISMRDIENIIELHIPSISEDEILECIEFMMKMRGEGFQ